MSINLTKHFQETARMMRTPMKEAPKKLSDVGLSNCKVLDTEQAFLAYAVSALISLLDFKHDNDVSLKRTITSYFNTIGIKNEQTLAMMTDISFFHEPKNEDEKSTITFIARMAMVQLAKITKTVRLNQCFLNDPDKIFLLVDWHDQMENIEEKKNSKLLSNGPQQTQAVSAPKFPTFDLKKFSTFEDDVNAYLESVEHDFTENKVVSFLQDESYADQHKDTSKAYCFTIFKSLNGSIYAYLKNEHSDTIFNTATLWKTLSTTLTTNISEMTAVNTAWSKIHNLKCNYAEDFEMFFNHYVQAELNLIKLNSTAIEDQCFLRSLLFHKLDIADMKSDISKLILNDKTDKARNILNTLKKKAKALSLNEKTGYSTSRRASGNPTEAKKPKYEAPPTKFPANYRNKIPQTIYSQMKQWYDIASIPVEKRTGDQALALAEYAFKVPHIDKNHSHSKRDQSQRSSTRSRKARVDRDDNNNCDTSIDREPNCTDDRYRSGVSYDNNHHNYNHNDQPYHPPPGNPPMNESYARRANHNGGYPQSNGYNNTDQQTRFHPSAYRGRGRGRGQPGYQNQTW